MAGRNVNVQIGNWQATGQNVPFPQYTADVALNWIGEDGQRHEHGGTYTFPNVLQNVPQRRLREYMEQIIMREARLALAVDRED
jgi:hypothetical protein